MYERFSTSASDAMFLATDEARYWQHEFMGAEHVLLGLLRERNGVAAKILGSEALDVEKIREVMAKLVLKGENAVTRKRLVQTPRMKKAIVRALEYARKLKHDYVGTGHILLGLLSDSESLATVALTASGVNVPALHERVERCLNHPPEHIASDDGPRPMVPRRSLLNNVLRWFRTETKDN